MTAGYNDTDAGSSTTYLATGGFKGKDHPKECLLFFYRIGVSNLVKFILENKNEMFTNFDNFYLFFHCVIFLIERRRRNKRFFS